MTQGHGKQPVQQKAGGCRVAQPACVPRAPAEAPQCCVACSASSRPLAPDAGEAEEEEDDEDDDDEDDSLILLLILLCLKQKTQIKSNNEMMRF